MSRVGLSFKEERRSLAPRDARQFASTRGYTAYTIIAISKEVADGCLGRLIRSSSDSSATHARLRAGASLEFTMLQRMRPHYALIVPNIHTDTGLPKV